MNLLGDAIQTGHFRRTISEASIKELLKTPIDTAVATKAAYRLEKFERVIVDSTAQERAIAHPIDFTNRSAFSQ